MKISDLFSLGIKNLWRRKLRTFLTILGVVIGATSIVVMLSLGLAQSKQIENMIKQSNGLTTINVSPTQWYDPSSGGKPPRKGIINKSVIKAMTGIEHVTGVIYADTLNGAAKISTGKYSVGGQLKGFEENALDKMKIKVKDGGRIYTDASPSLKEVEVIVSERIADMLYEEKTMGGGMYKPIEIDPMKAKFKLEIGNGAYGRQNLFPQGEEEGNQNKKETIRLKVVGVFESSGMSSYNNPIITSPNNIAKLQDRANKISMTSEEYKKSKSKNKEKYYDSATVYVDNMNNIDNTIQEIQKLDLNAYSDANFIKEMKKSTKTSQAILAGIGSISLIVAAIGITNTMVMSIYERTREIGVMKVIGASVKDIRNLFLLEAGMIGMGGGIVGVALSYLVSYIMNQIAAKLGFGGGYLSMGGTSITISIIPIWLAVSALVFSFLIGVITGYYPAKRATKLSAIEAIRTE